LERKICPDNIIQPKQYISFDSRSNNYEKWTKDSSASASSYMEIHIKGDDKILIQVVKKRDLSVMGNPSVNTGYSFLLLNL